MLRRALDILLVLLAAPFWLPLLLLGIFLVRIRLGTPVFFAEERAGLGGLPFKLTKLRSMTNELGANGELLPPEIRLTSFGRWLRASSLDELPELIQVLQGKMSLVGPRPLGVRYVRRYTNEQKRRLDVLPGITGWAQINGRNTLSWEEKFRLDVWYVDHKSIWLDLKILALSIPKVVKREGISQEQADIMPEFTGGNRPG